MANDWTRKEAATAAHRLMGYYPWLLKQPAQIQGEIHKQICAMLLDAGKEMTERVLTYVPRQVQWLSAYELRKWLDKQAVMAKSKRLHVQIEDDWKPPTPEEKERVKRKVLEFKAGLVQA